MYRIVQVSTTKFALERKCHGKLRTGWLWWRKEQHVVSWVPFGDWFNTARHTLVAGHLLPGRIERRFFDSQAEAQAYLDNMRAQSEYPKVIKEPA